MTFHLVLHFVVPALVSILFYFVYRRRKIVVQAYLLMMATMLIDLDHLLAVPIYDPSRCSINFHPLHRFEPMGLYMLLCIFPKTRWIGLGLVIHMALDTIDCQITGGTWYTMR